MKTHIKKIIFVSLILILFPSINVFATNRTALVIGNSAYKDNPLANPVNDAMLMHKVLSECNFDVIVRTDVNRKQMRAAIREFGNRIKKGGVGLFFFAGHGIQVKGENYLVPVQSEVLSEAEVPDECLLVSSVLRQMEAAENELNVIILDACRNNPYARSFRSSTRGLAKMDVPTGSILGYATAPGSVALDGTGSNGLYTSILAENILKPGLKIGDVFMQTRIKVVEISKKDYGMKQVPWEASSLMGDFYFKEGAQDSTITELKKRQALEKEKLHKIEMERKKEEQRLKEINQQKQQLKTSSPTKDDVIKIFNSL